MAVAENVGPKIGSPSQSFENTMVSSDSNDPKDVQNQKPKNDSTVSINAEPDFHPNGIDQNTQKKAAHLQERAAAATSFALPSPNFKAQMGQMQNGFETNAQSLMVKSAAGYGMNQRPNGVINGADGGENFKRDMRDLEDLLSKLNPMAEEFVPPSLAKNFSGYFGGAALGYTNDFLLQANSLNNEGNNNRRKKNGFSQGRRKTNNKMNAVKRDEMTRRTVYVSDIDQQVTEELLATVFANCGEVVDCRICGDPNSILHFAFIEFTDEEGARASLNLSGTVLGFYPVRVLPSKTAIAPVNPEFLPRSDDEREMCSRTIYCTNIDKKVTQAEVKLFFESLCGEVQRLRLLGDYHHSTRIAFVEFTMAESAIAALNCSGVVLGSLPIRVSPSKTPVRPRSPRAQLN
ncbi:polyadenylate-binding protein-interacting protein 12 [Cucurbita pepo subsp. pepo]|uniref:polyadenylate-binding protein-interacting protein 12 n=1 Tax=Cucurbita pepo subsp. pepo TaxID=3664 RepID=UPI000C9D8843|nr:polyadenylate-binding protein-interacting protein 12 [Cucurbita pepo subsp. pepo]XP_023552523.1 polyadenylate-binding protein-interacting protein 12 [Cucurbita pepo subsp. pepo]